MKRILTGLMLLLPTVGCFHLQPVGPLAKTFGEKPPETPSAPEPKAKAVVDKEVAAAPVIQAAPPPPLPSLKVTPGEVNANNHQEVARRLMEELEADRKALDSFPRYSEVSVVKGSR